jgi:hypothetical protein
MNTDKDWLIKSNLEINDCRKIIKNVTDNLIPIDTKLKSTRGKYSKQYDILLEFEKNNELKKILNIIKNHIFQILKTKFNYEFDLQILSAWTVYGKKGSYHATHRHNDRKKPHISTILYLQIPKNSNDLDGAFYFFINKNGDIEINTFIPKVSDFIIMPAWIYHGVYPQAKGLRQTLNIDFSINPI